MSKKIEDDKPPQRGKRKILLIALIGLLIAIGIAYAKEPEPYIPPIEDSITIDPRNTIAYRYIQPIMEPIMEQEEHAGNYYEIKVVITAYNSVPEQTDDTPCIGAGGYICGRNDVVACSRSIPLGTIVEIDNKQYVCLDRLSTKYDNRVDIFMDKDLEGARNWGKQIKTIKVYE